MASSSSATKKAARLAQKGKGKKVRFQGGTLFPIAVAIIFILGIGTVVYARQSRVTTEGVPTINDHWHHVYGFYICDTWVELSGDAEGQDAAGSPLNPLYVTNGVHSHEDGLIHWHPYSSRAVGGRAVLERFLEVYNVTVTNSEIDFPEDQRAQLPFDQDTGVFNEDDTKCQITDEDGTVTEEDALVSAIVWDSVDESGDGGRVVADIPNIRLDQDGMVVVVAFAPEGAEIGKPPWTADFETNSQIDTGQVEPASAIVPVTSDDVTVTSDAPATSGG